MHLGSIDIETPNDFDVAAQMLPNEQQRWRDFSSGFEILRYTNLCSATYFEPIAEKVSMANGSATIPRRTVKNISN